MNTIQILSYIVSVKLPKYTYVKQVVSNASTDSAPVTIRRGGSGWKEGGKEMLNKVYAAVATERLEHGCNFNLAVDQMLQEEQEANLEATNSKKRQRRAKVVIMNDL